MAGAISRGTLPQNFVDSVSAGMTLPTPEPQYFFAKMAQGGRMLAAALDAGAQTAQQFGSMSGSGQAGDLALDELIRATDAYPGAILAVDKFGLGKGDTVKLDRDVYSGGGYTVADRRLKTDQTISVTGQGINNEEVVIILEELTGPFASGGSVTQPYAIWDFDAKYRANKTRLADKVTRHLRRDYVKLLDRVIRAQFLASTNITMPTGITLAADFVTGAGTGISLEQVLAGKKALSDREWPKFPNGRYMCLVPTSFNTQMVSDSDYKELSKNHEDGRNLLYGYIGSIQDVDFFEVTTLANYSDNGGDDITTLAGSTVGATVVLNEALLFGPGAVGFATGASPECRWSDDTNYGTQAKVIWYALHGFQTVDVRGIQRLPYQGTDA